MQRERRQFEVAFPNTWLYRASRAQILCVAFAITIGLALLLGIEDWRVIRQQINQQAMLVIDSIIAVFCGALCWKIMHDAHVRTQALKRRLENIAELNHHIRNALETIQLSAHQTHNTEAISQINDAVERINWALREVLPEREDEQPETQPQ